MIDLWVGDIIAVDGSGLISGAIEAVEYGAKTVPRKYSHIAGYVGKGQLIEAEGLRVTDYADVSKYKGQTDVYRCLTMTRGQRQTMLKLARWSVGGHYDWKLLALEFMRYAFGVVIPYREPPNLRICSVLWSGIYRDAGIDLCPGIKYPTPKDLSESKLLVKIGSF